MQYNTHLSPTFNSQVQFLLNFIFSIILLFSLNVGTSLKSACTGDIDLNGGNIINVDEILYTSYYLSFNDVGVADGITNDSTITVAKLDSSASWEYTTNNGVNWTIGNTPDQSGTASFQLAYSSTTLLDNPDRSVSSAATATSFSGFAADVPDVWYFDITTSTSTSNEVIFESGGASIGMTVYKNGADLIITVGNNGDISDFTATGVLQDNTRYSIILEFDTGNVVNFYVGEFVNGQKANILTKYSGTWTGGTVWSGSDGAGWGVVNSHAHAEGSITYVSFSGTFNEGRFYSGLGKDDIWITPPATFLNTDIQVRQTVSGETIISTLNTFTGNITIQVGDVP